MTSPKRIILGISGASGAIYGIRALQLLRELGIETHLVISHIARQVIAAETDWRIPEVEALASHAYNPDDLAAPIASGSFHTDGMLVAPCSIKTLSGIATCYAENLIQRAADVCLKEGRPLLLAVRETPFHAGHLHLVTLAAQSGAIIFPPVPSFYSRPASLQEVIDQTVGRMLMRMDIENPYFKVWGKEEEII